MKMQVTLGHSVLIFFHSLALLTLGGAIGARCGASPTDLKIALVGAILMIVHDWLATIVWSWTTAKLVQASHTQNSSSCGGEDVVNRSDSPRRCERSRLRI